MKTSTIPVVLALVVSIASAAPSTTRHETRQVKDRFARVKLSGGDDKSFKWEIFPLDAEWYPIYNPLRVNSVSTPDNVTCQFSGTEGSATTLVGEHNGFIYVSPPQPQKSASCYQSY
ncbi:MAG: hypothetical protein Q9172_006726 [Xanthocarpia lactea]